jgi:hypothetical protein
MRKPLAAITCIVAVGIAVGILGLSTPASAQQKTVKACQAEWRADRVAYQAKRITEKAYIAECRARGATAAPAAPPARTAASPRAGAGQKTVKACQEEWRANKPANQANGITEKAFVVQCRAGGTIAQTPAPTPTAQTPAPTPTAQTPRPTPTAQAPAPTPTAQAPAPTPTAQTPAPTPPSSDARGSPSIRPVPGPTASTAPVGPNQFATEAAARGRCPPDTVVWVNLNSKIYHYAGHKAYGTTKTGAYMCEQDTSAQGMRASKNEKRPG